MHENRTGIEEGIRVNSGQRSLDCPQRPLFWEISRPLEGIWWQEKINVLGSGWVCGSLDQLLLSNMFKSAGLQVINTVEKLLNSHIIEPHNMIFTKRMLADIKGKHTKQEAWVNTMSGLLKNILWILSRKSNPFGNPGDPASPLDWQPQLPQTHHTSRPFWCNKNESGCQ